MARDGGEPDAVKQLRARGGMHVPPVRIEGGDRERWLVALGDATALHAMWIVTPPSREDAGADETSPIAFPIGVRVLDVVTRGGKAYVLVESLAVLDQPAGWRDVVTVDPKGAARVEERMIGVTDRSTLEKRLETRPLAFPEGAMDAAMAKASIGPTDLADAIAPEGVAVVRTTQEGVERVETTLDASAIAAQATELARALRDRVSRLASSKLCALQTDPTNDDCEGVVLRWDGTRARIRALRMDADTPPRAPPTTPHLVAASSTTSSTAAAWKRLSVRAPKAILGEAPLDDEGGTLGVVVPDPGDDPDPTRLLLVVAHPRYTVAYGAGATLFGPPLGDDSRRRSASPT